MDNPVTEQRILAAFDVSEVRLNEVDTAIAFAGGAAEHHAAWALRHHFSVLARFNKRIVGAALYFDTGMGKPSLEVRLQHGTPDSELSDEQRDVLRRLASVLVDKALLKLHSAGIVRFAITAAGRTDPGRFWADTNWLGQHHHQPATDHDPGIIEDLFTSDEPAESVKPQADDADQQESTPTDETDTPAAAAETTGAAA
ncbi:hypothetical protein [Mucisphaera calidilacus]|uniref:Uncharacterized protein n=1 Tax=Mucisphaera calidilacus TaxID=2527982 RepID=A0A518BTC1_9BACT|nr:hypothetical protein [Mucisphaera calidilacus]QDU70220.1 hypothetical protein Pan265_00420 [Mucisphaera calidilacus]